jgi:hypothetical protein
MQRARFARALGLLLVFGLGSSATSCGSDAQNSEAGGGIANESVRKDYQQKKAAASERDAAKRGGGGSGKLRPKSGI